MYKPTVPGRKTNKNIGELNNISQLLTGSTGTPSFLVVSHITEQDTCRATVSARCQGRLESMAGGGPYSAGGSREKFDDRYSSLARLKALGYFGLPKIRALYEATYFAGLRLAGMPEE
jgi:hypothetical protein